MENTKAQMRKGILELCVLSIISEKEEAYPSDIIHSLDQSKMIIKQGTLYPLLARLKNAGLLGYTWRESEVGPPRKYYQITDPGKDFLSSLLDTWNDLVNAVSLSTKNVTNQ